MMGWQMIPGVRGWSEHRVWGDHTGAWPLTVVSWSPDKDLLLWSGFLVRVLSLVAAEWIIMNKGGMIKWIQSHWAGFLFLALGHLPATTDWLFEFNWYVLLKLLGSSFLDFTERKLLSRYKNINLLRSEMLFTDKTGAGPGLWLQSNIIMRIILSTLSLPFPEPGRFQLHNRDLEHFLDIFSSGKKLFKLKEIFKLVLQRYFDRCQALNDVLWDRSWKSWRDFCPNHECNWWRLSVWVWVTILSDAQIRRKAGRRINSSWVGHCFYSGH